MARHDSHVDWKHLAIYGLVAAAVVVVGFVAIWSFIERQSLVIQPEPLPKITLVTQDATSPLAASWIRLLTDAELQPTFVPLETFDPIEGVVLFCDVEEFPSRLAQSLVEFLERGGAIAFVGAPPKTPIGRFKLVAESGMSDSSIHFAETASPVLARLNPGHELPVRASRVAFLKESPRMVVDARWKENARAVVMHLEQDGGRFLWFGFEPDALVRPDPQLNLLLRTSFRWVAGQPVSDGAVGEANEAKTLTPAARREARAKRFAFSVDRARNPKLFTVRMTNRGGIPLANPTVKVWLPPSVSRVELAGDIIMKRGATLNSVPGESACVVSLPRLTRNEDRVMKLRIIEMQHARR